MIELVIRVVFSLAVVLGLLWFVARTSSRRLGGRGRSMVRVVARQPLARAASLAVVEVGDRVLVVGISENGVSLLTEMDPDELPVEDATADAAERVGRRRVATPTLDGSMLSSQTWRQAWAAATSRSSGSSG